MTHIMCFTSVHTTMPGVQYHVSTVSHSLKDDKIKDYKENL